MPHICDALSFVSSLQGFDEDLMGSCWVIPRLMLANVADATRCMLHLDEDLQIFLFFFV